MPNQEQPPQQEPVVDKKQQADSNQEVESGPNVTIGDVIGFKTRSGEIKQNVEIVFHDEANDTFTLKLEDGGEVMVKSEDLAEGMQIPEQAQDKPKEVADADRIQEGKKQASGDSEQQIQDNLRTNELGAENENPALQVGAELTIREESGDGTRNIRIEEVKDGNVLYRVLDAKGVDIGQESKKIEGLMERVLEVSKQAPEKNAELNTGDTVRVMSVSQGREIEWKVDRLALAGEQTPNGEQAEYKIDRAPTSQEIQDGIAKDGQVMTKFITKAEAFKRAE